MKDKNNKTIEEAVREFKKTGMSCACIIVNDKPCKNTAFTPKQIKEFATLIDKKAREKEQRASDEWVNHICQKAREEEREIIVNKVLGI